MPGLSWESFTQSFLISFHLLVVRAVSRGGRGVWVHKTYPRLGRLWRLAARWASLRLSLRRLRNRWSRGSDGGGVGWTRYRVRLAPGRAVRSPFRALGIVCPVGLATVPAYARMGAVGDRRRLEQTLGAALSVGGGRMVAGAVHASGRSATGLCEMAERAAPCALQGKGFSCEAHTG